MAEILDLNNENIESQNQTSIEKIKFQTIDSGFNNIAIGSIVDNFDKINQNFSKIAAAEYLKGDKGNNVKIIEVSFKLGDDKIITKDGKSIYLNGSPVTGNDMATKIQDAIEILAEGAGLGPISGINTDINWDDNLKNEQHISFIVEEENDIYNIKSSLWYIYNDPRFANPQDNPKYSDLFNTSCVVYYDGVQFKAHQPFPTIYYHKTKGFCWKINNEETEISAQGIQGLPGNSYPVYIVRYVEIQNNELEVKITSIFSENESQWITTGTDLDKYNNCTAICIPDTTTDTSLVGKPIYLGILKAYSDKSELKAAVNQDLNLTPYFLSNTLSQLMDSNSEKTLFIPYEPKVKSSPVQVFKMTDENTLTVGIQNHKANTDTNLQLSYNKVDVNNGKGKVDGRATSLDWDTTQQSGDANNCYDSLSLRKYIVNSNIDNMFPSLGNNNSILWIGGGSNGKQGHQLGFSDNGNIYHRVSKPVGDDKKYTSWETLVTEIVNVTYDELVNLRKGDALIPGQKYRIIDYVTTVGRQNTELFNPYVDSAGHPFDIIIEALDINTLSEDVKACLHNGDTYFQTSNLDAWEIKYCLDNDTSRFSWADTTNGKGVIYYMKDEFNNICPYDFKNIRFVHTYLSKDGQLTIPAPIKVLMRILQWSNGELTEHEYLDETGQSYTKWQWENIGYVKDNPLTNENNIIIDVYFYTFSHFKCSFENPTPTGYTGQIPKELGKSTLKPQKYSDIQYTLESQDFSLIDSGCRNNIILPNGMYNIVLNENIFINTDKKFASNNEDLKGIKGCCVNNNIGLFCDKNYFGQYSHTNTIGDYCKNNIIHHNSYENIFEKECIGNEIECKCLHNKFGSRCSSNYLDYSCCYNIFETICTTSTFEHHCSYNKLDINCKQIYLANNSTENTFGCGCTNCSIVHNNGSSIANIFDNYCKDVHLTSLYALAKSNKMAEQIIEQIKIDEWSYGYYGNHIHSYCSNLIIMPGDVQIDWVALKGNGEIDLIGGPVYVGFNKKYNSGYNLNIVYSIRQIEIHPFTSNDGKKSTNKYAGWVSNQDNILRVCDARYIDDDINKVLVYGIKLNDTQNDDPSKYKKLLIYPCNESNCGLNSGNPWVVSMFDNQTIIRNSYDPNYGKTFPESIK